VFFPKLDKLDFAQEGHALEFDKPEDRPAIWFYRGVVYNEMKGRLMIRQRITMARICPSHRFPPRPTITTAVASRITFTCICPHDEPVWRSTSTINHPSNGDFLRLRHLLKYSRPLKRSGVAFEELGAFKRFDKLNCKTAVYDEKAHVRAAAGWSMAFMRVNERRTRQRLRTPHCDGLAVRSNSFDFGRKTWKASVVFGVTGITARHRLMRAFKPPKLARRLPPLVRLDRFPTS